MMFAVGVLVAGTVQAQDKSASFNQIIQSNSTVKYTLEIKGEPTIQLGSNMWFSGLFVDCLKPTEAWAMLNTSAPAKDAQATLPPSELPIIVPHSINDPADVPGAEFVLLRLSFP